jgi:lactoylglutathione lyase
MAKKYLYKERKIIMKIEHVAVYVNDLEKAKDFYIKYFEGVAGEKYVNGHKGFASYFITFSEGSRLELMCQMKITDVAQMSFLGYAHIAMSVGIKEKVDSITEQLRSDGYQVTSEPRTTGDGYYESCIMDSEGNLIEITV